MGLATLENFLLNAYFFRIRLTLEVIANFFGNILVGILCMAFIDMVRRSLCLLCNPNKSCLCNDGVLPSEKIREIEIHIFFRFKEWWFDWGKCTLVVAFMVIPGIFFLKNVYSSYLCLFGGLLAKNIIWRVLLKIFFFNTDSKIWSLTDARGLGL